MKKPTANTAAVLSNCAVASPLGKKALAKYSENAEYTYQSYHSTRLPTEPPKIDFRRRQGDFSPAAPGGWAGDMQVVRAGRAQPDASSRSPAVGSSGTGDYARAPAAPDSPCPSSPSKTSTSASADRSSSTTSTSRWNPTSGSAWWGATARASPPCCA